MSARTADSVEFPHIPLSDIEKEWEKRQERWDSVKHAWTETETVAKGTEIVLEPERGAVYPPVETTVEHSCRMLLQGGTVLFERNGPPSSASLRRFEEKRYLSAFDGALARNLSSGKAYPQDRLGFIAVEKEYKGGSWTCDTPGCGYNGGV
jgi:hypothetical protein